MPALGRFLRTQLFDSALFESRVQGMSGIKLLPIRPWQQLIL
jgi:hypothetical protein